MAIKNSVSNDSSIVLSFSIAAYPVCILCNSISLFYFCFQLNIFYEFITGMNKDKNLKKDFSEDSIAVRLDRRKPH